MPVVALPRLLDPATGGRRRIEVEGSDVGAVIAALLVEVPELEVHLFDERGSLRPHVSAFADGHHTRLDQPTEPVLNELRFIQAVSGG